MVSSRTYSGFSFFALILLCARLGLGQESFKYSGGVTAPTGSEWVVSGDFNGDGNADLATANVDYLTNTGGSISVFLSNGDGTFKSSVKYTAPTNCSPIYMAPGDFNNDKVMDLLVSCGGTATVFVLPGVGDGTFGPYIVTTLPIMPFVGAEPGLGILPYPTAPVADFNGDGKLDVIIPTLAGGFYSTVVLELLGRGDGTFEVETQAMNLDGQLPLVLSAGDFNGDGKIDLAVISGLENFDSSGQTTVADPSLRIGTNNGSGSFTFLAPFSLTSLPDYEMATGDMNGDGKLDVVLAGPSLTTAIPSGAVTLIGKGDGTFKQLGMVQDAATTYPLSLRLADLRNSGQLDVVAGGIAEPSSGAVAEVSMYQNNGDGTLQTPAIFTNGNQLLPVTIAVADINGDKRPDVILISLSTMTLTSAVQFLKNQTLPSTFTDTNAATFKAGGLATSSIVAMFGVGLATQTKTASGLPLPTVLGGVSINVTDSSAMTRAAPLFYVSPSQLNFAIPDGTAIGPATVSVVTSVGTVTVQQQIVATSGGIFNASNLAVADVFTYNGSAAPVVTETFALNSQGALVPEPIDVGTGSQLVYLILFGTGVRNHASAVTATIGTTTVPVVFAGAQGAYVGEDQINILLPQSLRGAGLVNLTLNVDGQITNAVQIQIQ